MNRFAQPVNLNTWAEVRDFWERFKASRYAERIYLDEMALQRQFVQACTNLPSQQSERLWGRAPLHHGLLLGYQGKPADASVEDAAERLMGVIAVKEQIIEDAFLPGDRILSTYIMGVYVDPHAGRSFSSDFMAYLDQWSLERGHLRQTGSGRAPKPGENNYKLDAVFERYGFQAAYMVVQKDLKEEPHG